MFRGYTVRPQVVEHGSEVRAVPVDEITPPGVSTELGRLIAEQLRQPRVGVPPQGAQERRKQLPTNVDLHHGGLGAEEVIKNEFTDGLMDY